LALCGGKITGPAIRKPADKSEDRLLIKLLIFMKKYLLLLSVAAGFLAASSSCKLNVMKGEGKKITSAPAIAPFDAIDIEIPLKVSISLQDGSVPGVQINGYENIMHHIKTRVENNMLHIYCDLGEIWSVDYDDFTTEITLPSLQALTLSGAPVADIHGNIAGGSFKLDISGAGKVSIDNINVDKFTSQVSGAADIEVKGGAAKFASYEISGAGKIIAFPLQSNETDVNISGAGKGEITALTKLSASISGAGIIKYKGHPAVTQDVSGAGAIKDVN
jgi:hypothetical protein